MPNIKERATTIILGAVLAGSAAACEDPSKPAITDPSPVSSPQTEIINNILVISLKDNSILKNLSPDNSCGVLLNVGQSTELIFNVADINGRSGVLNLLLEATKNNGTLEIAGFPIHSEENIAITSPSGIVPLGKVFKITENSLLFAPYLQRNFSVPFCASDQS